MTLPTSGPISLSQIQTEFNGTNPPSLNQYYRGGSFVPISPRTTTIPASGVIKLSDFYNTARSLLEWTLVGPNAVTTPTANIIGPTSVFNGYVIGSSVGFMTTSPTSGPTWTSRSIGSSVLKAKYNYFDGTNYITCANNNAGTAGGQLCFSIDGTTWTAISGSAVLNIVNTVIKLGTRWVVLGSFSGNAPASMSSTILNTGTFYSNVALSPSPLTSTDTVFCSAASSSLIIAGCTLGKIITSTNGTTWALATSPFSSSFRVLAVAFLNSLYWAVGFNGTTVNIASSSTGTSGWTITTTLSPINFTTSSGNLLTPQISSDGTILLVQGSGNFSIISNDNINFYSLTTIPSDGLVASAYSSTLGKFVGIDSTNLTLWIGIPG